MNKIILSILRIILCMFIFSCSSILNSESKRKPSQIDQPESSLINTAVNKRTYPSIFQAWQAVTMIDSTDKIEQLAKHDLIWQSWSAWGLKCKNNTYPGLCTEFTDQSIINVLDLRNKLKKLNPNIILLAEVRYHDANLNHLPDDSQWWLRDDKSKNKIPKVNGTSTTNYFLLDYSNSEFQNSVANLCRSLIMSKAVDGCMLDWWNHETPSHVSLIQKVRYQIGDQHLLIVNTNGSLPLLSAPFINGMYMEGFGQKFFSDWKTARDNLQWAKSHLRSPVITAFDAWGSIKSDDNSFRVPQALSLIFSDGYFLFGDKLHNHVWHSLWNIKLGEATSNTFQKNLNGSYSREYQNGLVIFNPPDNKDIEINFDELKTRSSNNETTKHFILKSNDGDFFLKTTN